MIAPLLVAAALAAAGPPDPGAPPRAAVRQYLEALVRGDAAAALALVVDPSDMDRAVVRAQAAGAEALGRLEKVSTSRFGARGDLGVAAQHRRLLAAVARAPVEVDGDRAVLRPEGEKSFRLRRAGGGWRIESPAERLTGADQEAIEQALKRTETAAQDVAERIRARAVRSAEEAREALRRALGKEEPAGVPL